MIETVLIFICVVFLVIFVTPFGVLFLGISLFGFRRPMKVVLYKIAQGWARTLILIIRCKVTVTGRENIPKKGSLCFVSNHGSIFDIVLLAAYAGRPAGFVAKKELLLLPLINMWISILGGLFIDRKNPRKALKTINKGIERIKKGGAMIIFPEGHRSRGQGLLPFHPGSLKLATQSGAAIVPVALQGTYDIFEKNYRVCGGPVKVTFCPSINPNDFPPQDRKMILCDRIYELIKKELEK